MEQIHVTNIRQTQDYPVADWDGETWAFPSLTVEELDDLNKHGALVWDEISSSIRIDY